MFDDLKTLIDEFDLHTLTHPASVEQFILNLIIVAILFGLAWAVFRLLGRLF